MLTVIGAILAIGGAAALIAVIVRATPRLARLRAPLPTPVSRESAVKERLFLDRLTRHIQGAGERFSRRTSAGFRSWESQLQRGYRRLRLLAQEYVVHHPESNVVSCEGHIAAADDAVTREEYDEAEEHLLACLKIDPKHRGAYLGLSDVYQQRKEEGLAEETLRFLRRLHPDDADVAARLAGVLHARGKRAAALKEIQAAIDQSPRNPKYLDFAIELAMMERNPRLATKYLTQLREANPENQKLEELEEQIAALRERS